MDIFDYKKRNERCEQSLVLFWPLTRFAALSLGDTADRDANCAAEKRRQLRIWAKMESGERKILHISIFYEGGEGGREVRGRFRGDSLVVKV